MSQLTRDVRANAWAQVAPCLSVKAHSGWIADIQFTQHAAAAHDTARILSVSNDKSVVLSELELDVGAGAVQNLKPVARLSSLHTGGIFSMHYQNGEFLTCSKDGSVSLCQVSEAKLTQLNLFDDVSDSVLKSVRWQPNGMCLERER